MFNSVVNKKKKEENLKMVCFHLFLTTSVYIHKRRGRKGFFPREGFCPRLKICRGDFIHLVRKGRGDFILVAKIMGGILSTYTKMTRGDSVREGLCPYPEIFTYALSSRNPGKCKMKFDILLIAIKEIDRRVYQTFFLCVPISSEIN